MNPGLALIVAALALAVGVQRICAWDRRQK